MESLTGTTRSHTSIPAVTLRVVPEQARLDLTAAVEAPTASGALALLKKSLASVEAMLPALHATMNLLDFDVPHDGGKLSTPETRLRAVVTLGLPVTLPAIERAGRVAALDDALRAAAAEAKRQKPVIDLRRSLPVYVVVDPEHFRGALVQRLHERARSLGGPAGVTLRELRFDRPVEQRSLGLQEVELLLPVEGTASVRLT
jgi:hypothetical protein